MLGYISVKDAAKKVSKDAKKLVDLRTKNDLKNGGQEDK